MTCGKTYMRNMKAYLEHCRQCGSIGSSSQCSSQSSSQYSLLLECIERISSLEREVAALKTKGVRRVNVLVWLDNNIKPKSSYIDHFRSHPVSDQWLDIGRDASTMFAEWCADSLSTSDPPLRTFSSMKHTLFRYEFGEMETTYIKRICTTHACTPKTIPTRTPNVGNPEPFAYAM